jgi:hypothetical protein
VILEWYPDTIGSPVFGGIGANVVTGSQYGRFFRLVESALSS